LLNILCDDDWTGWCEFFLRATREQAARNEARVRQIFDLYQQRKEWIIQQTRSPYAIWALDFIFSNPIFNASEFIEKTRASRAAANRILNILVSAGLFATVQSGVGRRPAIYAYSELLDLTEGVRAIDDHT
jgi:Fic family protein